MIIMTMWLDFCSIFTIFNYEYFPKFAKLGSKFYQILNKPSKKFQPFKMLVTLRWLVRLPLGWMETLHVDRLKTDSNYEQCFSLRLGWGENKKLARSDILAFTIFSATPSPTRPQTTRYSLYLSLGCVCVCCNQCDQIGWFLTFSGITFLSKYSTCFGLLLKVALFTLNCCGDL